MISKAIQLAVEGRHDKAQALKNTITDQAAHKLLDWYHARGSKLTAGFDKIAAFLKSSPHWPQMNLIQARAEAALYRDPQAPERVLSHFKSYPAQTGFGMIAHARALLRTGKPERAAELVRTAWREHNFGSAAEKAIRKEFKKVLTGDDHRARLVRQLYARQTKEALRTAAMISAAHVNMVKAASALFKRHRHALRRYKMVPSKLRNQLVMQYALAHYYRRKGKSAKALDIVLKVPGNLGDLSYPEPWWRERWALIRTSLDRDTPKSWKSAYDMAAAHGLKEGTFFVQGEFMSGWIALRFLKQPKRAIKHLELILERDIKPLNLAQANYWLARAHQALKDEARAKAHFEAAAKFPTAFYGQLSLDALGRGSAPIQMVNGPELSDATKAVFGQRDVIRAIRLLAQAGQKRMLPIFFNALSYRLESGEERVALASLALEMGDSLAVGQGGQSVVARGIRLATVRLSQGCSADREDRAELGGTRAGLCHKPAGERVQSAGGQPCRRAWPDADDADHGPHRDEATGVKYRKASAARKTVLQRYPGHCISGRSAGQVRRILHLHDRRLQRGPRPHCTVEQAVRRPTEGRNRAGRLDRIDSVQRNPATTSNG